MSSDPITFRRPRPPPRTEQQTSGLENARSENKRAAAVPLDTYQVCGPILDPLATRTSEVAEACDDIPARRARDERADGYYVAFVDDVRKRATDRLTGVEAEVGAISDRHRDLSDANPAWDRLRAGMRADVELAAREEALMLELVRVHRNLRGDSAVTPAYAQRATELQRALDLVKEARVKLRIENPALVLLDPASIDPRASNAELAASLDAGARELLEKVRDVKARIDSRDIDVEGLDQLVAKVMEEQGISREAAELGDERSRAIFDRLDLNSERRAVVNLGVTAAAVVLGVAATLVPGGAAVALGLIGAGLGLGTGIYELEIADDVADAADASLRDEDALADPNTARAERVFAVVSLALAAADVAIAARAMTALTRASSLVRRCAGAEGVEVLARLTPQQIVAFDRAALAGDGAAFAKLAAELPAEVFERARAFFERRAVTMSSLGVKLEQHVFDELYAALGPDGIRRLAAVATGPEIGALYARLGAARVAQLAKRHGEVAVVRIGTQLNPSRANEVFRAFADCGGELERLVSKVDAAVLADLVEKTGVAELRRQIGFLGVDGLAHVIETFGEAGALGLLRAKVSAQTLDRLRRELADPAARGALSRTDAVHAVALFARGIGPAELARVVAAADDLCAGAGRDVAAYLVRLKGEVAAVRREMTFAERAIAVEKLDGGHSLASHGPQVSDAALERRVRTGVAPDGRVSPADNSMRFASFEVFVKSREEAIRTFEQMEGVDCTKPPPAGWQKRVERAQRAALADPSSPTMYEAQPGLNHTTEHAHSIGGGHRGTGTKNTDGKWSGSSHVAEARRTNVKVVWLGETNDPTRTRGRWAVVQFFPDINHYDAATGRYTRPADRSVPRGVQ